jgi:hypothetical protein
MKHSVEITVDGTPEGVYDGCMQYFSKEGFKLVSADRPNVINFRRGGIFGLGFKSAKTNLTVVIGEDNGKVKISCLYDMPGTVDTGESKRAELEGAEA